MWCAYQCQMLIVAGLLLPMSALAERLPRWASRRRINWNSMATRDGIASSGPGGSYGHLCPQG